MVLKKKMEKEKTPVERLHDDIRRAIEKIEDDVDDICLLYTSPSPRDATLSRMPSSA